ncbi:MAG: hypothetical protein ACXWV9_01470 [Flavisolibacter sp.]
MFPKYFISSFILFIALHTSAQKNVRQVSQSILTGVTLPQGSKQDKRFLVELSAKTLLESESKKVNARLKITEVFYLPSVSVSGFNADSLVNQLTNLGWNIIPLESDDKYVWLQKDNRSIITYFLMNEKQTELYFGEAETPLNLLAVFLFGGVSNSLVCLSNSRSNNHYWFSKTRFYQFKDKSME